MKDQTKIVVALLAGVAAGTVIGMLLAPNTGEDNRQKLAGMAKDIYDSAKDLATGGRTDEADEDPENALGV